MTMLTDLAKILGSDARVEVHVLDFKGGVDREPLSRFVHLLESSDHEMVRADLTELHAQLAGRAFGVVSGENRNRSVEEMRV